MTNLQRKLPEIDSKEELYQQTGFYDIIVGDFGRDAAIEYLRLMSNYETDLPLA